MPLTPVFPDGAVFLTLLIAPFTAGTLCGLTGSGSAIIIQVMFRLFHSLLGLQVADNETDEARRILAIAAVLSLTQYPVAVWRLWHSKERHIRWDAVLYLFPGINILVWVGTFIAMHWPPGVLLYILGVTLIVIALWQFIFQSVIGRKVDDEQIKVTTRRRLNQKRQLMLISGNGHDGHRGRDSNGTSGSNTNNNNNINNTTTTSSSTSLHDGPQSTNSPSQSSYNTTTRPSDGTSLDDLETLGDVAPKLPKSLKAPNPSFDLRAYSERNGLDLTMPENHNLMMESIAEEGDSRKGKKKANKGNKNYGQHFNISQQNNKNSSQNSSTLNSSSTNNGSVTQLTSLRYGDGGVVAQGDSAYEDDYTMINMGEDDIHRINDNRTFIQKIIDDAKNNPKIMIIGLVSGCIAGLLGGMMGINGPPVILFLFFLKLNGAQLRDTSMLVFFTNLPCLLLSRLIFNVFHLEEWLIYIIAITASTTGLFIGSYFHSYCDTRLIMTCLQIIILLSSITLTKPGTGTPTAITFLVIYLAIALTALGFVGWRMARNRLIKEKTKQQFYTLHGGREENEVGY